MKSRRTGNARRKAVVARKSLSAVEMNWSTSAGTSTPGNETWNGYLAPGSERVVAAPSQLKAAPCPRKGMIPPSLPTKPSINLSFARRRRTPGDKGEEMSRELLLYPNLEYLI